MRASVGRFALVACMSVVGTLVASPLARAGEGNLSQVAGDPTTALEINHSLTTTVDKGSDHLKAESSDAVALVDETAAAFTGKVETDTGVLESAGRAVVTIKDALEERVSMEEPLAQVKETASRLSDEAAGSSADRESGSPEGERGSAPSDTSTKTSSGAGSTSSPGPGQTGAEEAHHHGQVMDRGRPLLAPEMTTNPRTVSLAASIQHRERSKSIWDQIVSSGEQVSGNPVLSSETAGGIEGAGGESSSGETRRSSEGDLPFTGADLSILILVATCLAAMGSIFSTARRRRTFLASRAAPAL